MSNEIDKTRRLILQGAAVIALAGITGIHFGLTEIGSTCPFSPKQFNDFRAKPR